MSKRVSKQKSKVPRRIWITEIELRVLGSKVHRISASEKHTGYPSWEYVLAGSERKKVVRELRKLVKNRAIWHMLDLLQKLKEMEKKREGRGSMEETINDVCACLLCGCWGNFECGHKPPQWALNDGTGCALDACGVCPCCREKKTEREG